MTTRHLSDTLRRAATELCMVGEDRLARDVAAIRLATCALVDGVQREREATTATDVADARHAIDVALADLAKPRA